MRSAKENAQQIFTTEIRIGTITNLRIYKNYVEVVILNNMSVRGVNTVT